MISLRIYTWNNVVDKYNYEIKNNENWKWVYNIYVLKIRQGKYIVKNIIIVLFLIKNRGIINIIIFITFSSLNNLFFRNATEISCIYILGWIFLSSCLISVCRSVVSFISSEMYSY